jgi:hypothetical protein
MVAAVAVESVLAPEEKRPVRRTRRVYGNNS